MQTSGTSRDNGKITLSSMSLGPAAATTGETTANLTLNFTKKGFGASANQTISKKIPMLVVLDSASKVKSCYFDKESAVDTACTTMGGVMSGGKCTNLDVGDAGEIVSSRNIIATDISKTPLSVDLAKLFKNPSVYDTSYAYPGYHPGGLSGNIVGDRLFASERVAIGYPYHATPSLNKMFWDGNQIPDANTKLNILNSQTGDSSAISIRSIANPGNPTVHVGYYGPISPYPNTGSGASGEQKRTIGIYATTQPVTEETAAIYALVKDSPHQFDEERGRGYNWTRGALGAVSYAPPVNSSTLGSMYRIGVYGGVRKGALPNGTAQRSITMAGRFDQHKRAGDDESSVLNQSVSLGYNGGVFPHNLPMDIGVYAVNHSGDTNSAAIYAAIDNTAASSMTSGAMAINHQQNAIGWIGVFGRSFSSGSALYNNYAGYFQGGVLIEGNIRTKGDMTTDGLLTINNPTAGGGDEGGEILFGGGPSTVNLDNYQGNLRVHGLATNKKFIVNGQGDSIAWNSASDRRWKKNITPLKNSIEKIKKINGVNYNWATEEYPEKNFSHGNQIGVIAQNIQTIFPELVTRDDQGFLSVNYSALVAPLIEAVKEQQQQIDTNKKEINSLQYENSKIKAESLALY